MTGQVARSCPRSATGVKPFLEAVEQRAGEPAADGAADFGRAPAPPLLNLVERANALYSAVAGSG
jgi:hypothetical protein